MDPTIKSDYGFYGEIYHYGFYGEIYTMGQTRGYGLL